MLLMYLHCSLAGETRGAVLAFEAQADLDAAAPLLAQDHTVLLRFQGPWQIIPAENLVALAQNKAARIVAECSSAAEGRKLFEALEVGVECVLLKTADAAEVKPDFVVPCIHTWNRSSGPCAQGQRAGGLHKAAAGAAPGRAAI